MSGKLDSDGPIRPLVLTESDRRAIAYRAKHGLVWTLAAQAAMAAIVIVLCWVLAGGAAAVSALVGAAAYFVPNALFALLLLPGALGLVQPSPYTFFLGEAFKLGTALAVLGLAAWLAQPWLVWPALVAGLVGVLKGYVLLMALRRLP